LIHGQWQSASMQYREDIQNYFNSVLVTKTTTDILDFHTHFCRERPKETQYQISYKEKGQIEHIKVAAPYLSVELTIRITRMIPPIATFRLVHESYTLDGDLSNLGVMIDISWKEHDFRVPLCWMMRLETNTGKKFMKFVEDRKTSEEMVEIMTKLRLQFDAKEKEKSKSKIKLMNFLLQRQSAFTIKRVVRQANGNYLMTVKIIDQTGKHRQLVALLKETKVSMLNESQKTEFDRLLRKGLKRQSTNQPLPIR